MSAIHGEPPATIDHQARVSVALLGGIFIVLTSATWGAARWCTRIEGRLEGIERELASLWGGRWTRTDMLGWSRDLQQLNDKLNVPLISDTKTDR